MHGFRIGDLHVEPQLNTIFRPDGEMYVEPKVMNVLVLLAERECEVVDKNEIVRCVWGDTVVSDDSLVRCISMLRKALHDNPKDQRIIQTISKRGYRLQSPVAWDSNGPQRAGQPMAPNLEDVLSACSDHIYIYDGKGRYLFASASGAKALGAVRQDIEGKSWQELGMPSQIMTPFHRKVETVFKHGRSVREEVAYPTIDGNRYYEYILDPIRSGNDKIIAVLAVVRDVTLLRRDNAEAEH